jgi:hypothetical protein
MPPCARCCKPSFEHHLGGYCADFLKQIYVLAKVLGNHFHALKATAGNESKD